MSEINKNCDEKINKFYLTKQKSNYNRTFERIEFIKLLLEGTDLEPMFNYEQSDEDIDDIANKKDIRDVFKKKLIGFKDIIQKIGGKLLYVKSGTTGHTFKGISMPDPEHPDMVVNYAVKIVAYPKKENYGSINDPSRPENAELMMLKVLSYFVVNNQTPHVVLPIATFNTKIHPFITLTKTGVIGSKKYEQFVKRYEEGDFYEDVSILISEWADGSDLLEYLRENFTKLTVKEWRVMFFQILSVLAIIQTKYPTFRHNDLKANNILIQKIQQKSKFNTYKYTINNNEYFVPNTGVRCKLWDFDFACIPGLVENAKVDAEWTNKINIKAKGHMYYDVHYFFNTLVSKGFITDFFNCDTDGNPYVPNEVTEFVKRVIPSSIRKGKHVSERGRLLIEWEDLHKIKDLKYKTPDEIIINDPFFEKMRAPKNSV
jgi:serine/threonine protein kinase